MAFADILRYPLDMRKRRATRRSNCPLNASLEMVGDRWSLLIVRDMMLRGASTFAEFLDGYEHIATNILTDRLRSLCQTGILKAIPHPDDGRRKIYRLTKKGIDLAPVLTEMVLWASTHEVSGNRALVRQMRDKDKFLAQVRARWRASAIPTSSSIRGRDKRGSTRQDAAVRTG